MATTFKTITKAELLQALADLNDNDHIAVASDYGDRCHTQQLHRLRGNVEEVAVRESGYSDSGFAVDEDGDSNAQTVYLLQ
jgi:hypothetical protein